jgi:tRNA(Ile)-lysidine synthase
VNNLLERIEESIRERTLFRRSERILVAVSGGVDSMVLLHLLHALAARNRWELFVAHFNHQLRGRSSDADERFVRKTAVALGLPFSAGRGSVKALAKEWGQSIEMVARGLRHEFFARTAKRLRIRVVVLAHHADDQVELFFLRLLRGAGGEGIAGMKWRSPSPASVRSPAFRRPDDARQGRLKAGLPTQLVRPLLDVSRTELEQFARENKIRFREDFSNASCDFLRNRIRHELLPLLRHRFQPALNKTVLRLMEIAGAEANFADAAARAWLKERRPSFDELATPVARRVLQLQLQQHKIAPDFELIELLRLVPHKPVALSPVRSVARDAAGHVSLSLISFDEFKPGRLAVNMKARAGQGSFGGLRFRWRIVNRQGTALPRRARGSEVFDRDKIGGRIVLHHWQPGDRFQPIGLRASVKLQDWFTNQKVPRVRRRELVVATTERGEVFWVEDQRIGDRFKLTPETKRRLIWRWQRR